MYPYMTASHLGSLCPINRVLAPIKIERFRYQNDYDEGKVCVLSKTTTNMQDLNLKSYLNKVNVSHLKPFHFGNNINKVVACPITFHHTTEIFKVNNSFKWKYLIGRTEYHSKHKHDSVSTSTWQQTSIKLIYNSLLAPIWNTQHVFLWSSHLMLKINISDCKLNIKRRQQR